MDRVASVIAAVVILGVAAPAAARPWVYLSTWSYSGSTEKCLGQAKAALEKQGFIEDLEITYHKDRKFGGYVEGLLPSAPVRAKIDCNKVEGITGLAVTGLDNDLTYSKYDKLFDSQW